MGNTENKNNNNNNDTVVLASRLPANVKEKVEKFAERTMRTASQAVHYLLETHPELNDQKETALAK